MGAVLREQNALPNVGWVTKKKTAKDAIDNGGAGRAAKGANPSACAKNSEMRVFISEFFCWIDLIFTLYKVKKLCYNKTAVKKRRFYCLQQKRKGDLYERIRTV